MAIAHVPPFSDVSPRAFVACAALLLASGCKHIHTELEIDAPPDAVWAVLADFESYEEWNPYHVRVVGELKHRAKLEVEIHKPNGHELTIHPRVQAIECGRELTWGGGVPGIFTGRHVFRLEALSAGRTNLVQEESFRGIAVPFAELDAIEEGYDAVNHAVAERVNAQQARAKRQRDVADCAESSTLDATSQASPSRKKSRDGQRRKVGLTRVNAG